MTTEEKETLRKEIAEMVGALPCANSDCGMREHDCTNRIFNHFYSLLESKDKENKELMEKMQDIEADGVVFCGRCGHLKDGQI